MKRLFISFTLSAFVFAACSEEIQEPDQNLGAGGGQEPEVELPELKAGEIAFVANGEFFFENKEEKTEGVMLAFEEGDMAQFVYKDGSQVKTVEAQVKSTKDGAFLVASAQKEVKYQAVYPAAAFVDAALSSDALRINVAVPAEQDGSLASADIAVAESTGADAELNFKNLCGLLKFTVYSDDVKSVTVRGVKGETLAGTLPVLGFDSETGNPLLGEAFDTASEVTVRVDGKPGTYYAALLPGLVMEEGFVASFEMMEGAQKPLSDAKSNYEVTLTRSTYTVLGQIEDYIPQLDWFVTPEGTETADGKTWETAISAEQMFQMLAFNRATESGTGNSSTDIGSAQYKEEYASYLQEHNTRHALQLDGTTFHLCAGEYRTANYVRVSFPELGRQVAISLKGGYDPASTDTDLSKRDIEAYETRFIKPYGSGTARVFFFQQWLDMAIDGVTFYGGVGDSGVGGGALLLNESNTSKVSITRCKFDSNTSNSYGGAIVGSKLVGDITIEDCHFTKNKCAKDGGAIRLTAGKWIFRNCSFSENESQASGAGIHASGIETQLTIADCSFIGNKAEANAGAIHVGTMEFSATGTVFENNICTPSENNNGQGGAIYFATDKDHLESYAERTLTGCTFKDNSVSALNSVYNDDVKRYVRGGAIYVSGLPKVTITGGSFTGNSQKDYSTYKMYGGGAIFSISEVALSGVTFSGNSAYYGGALNFAGLTTCTQCTFTGNSAVYGGALNGIASSTAVFTECEVSENETTNNGGAAWLNPVKSVTFDRCTFKKNKVTENNVGGVFYFSGTSSLTLLGGVYEGNSAGKSGGVIYCSGLKAEISITDSQFKDNEARSADGGVIWNSGVDATISIGGKASFTGNKAGGDGGVFRATVNSTWTIDGTVTIADNNAAKQGGAFCSERPSSDKEHPAPTVNITGASFNNNKANGGEAGAIIFYGGDWTLSGCSLVGNSATSNGGAIYSNTGKLSVRNTLFSGNSTATTGVGGGAIYVTTNSVIDIDESEFIGNMAPSKNGGAINIASTAKGLHKINNSYFEGNGAIEAGALWTAAGGTLYLNGCSFYGNKPTKKNTGGVVKVGSLSFINNCSFVDNSGADWESSLIITGTTTLLNSTLIEKSSATLSAPMNAIRLYGSSAVGNIYNNVILSASRSLAAAYGSNPGSVESKGYNYTGAWSTQGNGSVTASATTISTDNIVTPKDMFGSFAYPSSSAFHKYYTWTIPDGKSQTTLSDMTAFLKGISGGADFAAWLGSVSGLSHDIAGNARPETGKIYPGCYQGK